MILSHRFTRLALAVGMMMGCGKPATPRVSPPADAVPATNARRHLSPTEVMERFRVRASADDLRKFAELAASADQDRRVRALEMVLFSLSDDELFSIGITQSQQPDGFDWAVAWSPASGEASNAIGEALKPDHIGCFGSIGHGHAGWYVSREQFFSARRALLQSPSVKALKIDVVTPKFELP